MAGKKRKPYNHLPCLPSGGIRTQALTGAQQVLSCGAVYPVLSLRFETY